MKGIAIVLLWMTQTKLMKVSKFSQRACRTQMTPTCNLLLLLFLLLLLLLLLLVMLCSCVHENTAESPVRPKSKAAPQEAELLAFRCPGRCGHRWVTGRGATASEQPGAPNRAVFPGKLCRAEPVRFAKSLQWLDLLARLLSVSSCHSWTAQGDTSNS